jgi:hypothetical protein
LNQVLKREFKIGVDEPWMSFAERTTNAENGARVLKGDRQLHASSKQIVAAL